jgi:hypothetical protein
MLLVRYDRATFLRRGLTVTKEPRQQSTVPAPVEPHEPGGHQDRGISGRHAKVGWDGPVAHASPRTEAQ